MLKKLFFLFLIILCVRLLIEVLVASFFLKKEPQLYKDILQLKYKLIEPVRLRLDGLSTQDLKKIEVSRFSFKKNKIDQINFTDLGEDYFFYTKLTLEVPKESLANLNKITIYIGQKKFSFTKEEFLKDWQRKEEEKVFVISAPPTLKNNSIISKLFFFSPQLSSVINWNNQALVIIFLYIINQLFIPLILILTGWYVLESLDFSKKSKLIEISNQKKIEYLDNFLTVFLTIVFVLLLIYIIPFIYKPDLGKIIKEAARRSTYNAINFSPEPVERLLYMLAVSFTPFFVLFSSFLAERCIKNFKTKLLKIYYPLKFTTFLLIIILVNFWWLSKYDDYFSLITITNLQKPFQSVMEKLIIFLLPFLIFKLFSKNTLKKCWLFLSTLFIFLVIGSVVISHLINFNLSSSTYHNFEAVFYSVTQVYSGKILLVDFYNQYGLYPHFLEPIFRLIGLSVLKFSLVVSLLLGLAYVFIFLALKKIIKNPVVLFLGFISLIYFNLIGKILGSMDPYYQFWPIRLFFPSLTIFLVINYLCRPSKLLYYFIFMITSIAILWNVDSGAVVFFSWLLVLFYKDFNFKHLFRGAVILFLAIFSYSFYIYLRYHVSPNFLNAFSYQKIYYISGLFMEPMRLFDTWNLIILIYLIGMVKAIKKRFHKPIIFFLSVLGLGAFSYFQGRSVRGNLPPITYPAFMLLTIYADNLWENLKLYRQKFASQTLEFIIIFFVFIFSFFCLLEKSKKETQIIKTNLDSFREVKSSLSENIEFIKSQTKKGEKIFIITFDKEGIFYAETQTVCALGKPSFNEIFLKNDFQRIEDFLENNQNFKVFYDTDIVLIDNKTDYLGRMARKLLVDYKVLETSKNGQFWLMAKKGN